MATYVLGKLSLDDYKKLDCGDKFTHKDGTPIPNVTGIKYGLATVDKANNKVDISKYSGYSGRVVDFSISIRDFITIMDLTGNVLTE